MYSYIFWIQRKDIDFNQVRWAAEDFVSKEQLINARVVYSTLPTKAKDGSPLETDGIILQVAHSLSVCIGSNIRLSTDADCLSAWPHGRKEKNCNPGSNQLFVRKGIEVQGNFSSMVGYRDHLRKGIRVSGMMIKGYRAREWELVNSILNYYKQTSFIANLQEEVAKYSKVRLQRRKSRRVRNRNNTEEWYLLQLLTQYLLVTYQQLSD